MGMQTELETVQDAANTLCVMDQTGDTRTIWSPDNEAEVAAAKSTFDALKAKGYLAYQVKGEKGENGEVMKEFDPKAGRVIMIPQPIGG
jgi:hypothetical protein